MRTDGDDYRRVRMLMEVLPAVAAEDCFALKGGTAINLFFLDLPRLSVDIDLTYLSFASYAEAMAGIDAALRRIRDRLTGASPPFTVRLGPGRGSGHVDTLHVERDSLDIKIEVNPVLRGTLHATARRAVRPAVEARFGYAQMAVLAPEEVYAGKLVAALDRQHPRDLFDAKLLLDDGGLTDALFRSFLVYLAGHKGVIAHALEPRRRDIGRLYQEQLRDMVAQPVSLEALLEARERLIREIHARMGDAEKRFMLSVKRMRPDGGLIGLPQAAELPAIRWKLHNLAQMAAEDRQLALTNLETVLDRISK